MAPSDVRVELHADGVATLEICRGPNNFFDTTLITALADECERLAAVDCRAVVLCSEGRHFCAGADFSLGDTAGPTDGPHIYEPALRLFAQPLPVVAAVQGAALGGGLGLALTADFRVAGPRARFAASFSRLGFHHGFGLTVTLPLVVGHQAALDLLYAGRRVQIEEASAIGLVDDVVGEHELRTAAHARAASIAAAAPLAVRSIRATMRGPLVDEVRVAMVRERAEQERLQQTSDWREGIAAMAERREPRFRGA